MTLPLPLLTCSFELLTPTFLGGVDGQPELRVPSIRGALRHWLRAIDPAWRTTEPRLFGSTRRQGAVLLASGPPSSGSPWQWSGDSRRFDSSRFRTTVEGMPRNGVQYLGYVFALKGNEHRAAFPPGTTFSLQVLVPRLADLDVRERWALVGCLWAWAHLGALGSRARRGFGSVQLTRWSWNEAGREAGGPIELPLVEGAGSPREAIVALATGLTRLEDELGLPVGRVPHLGARCRVGIVGPMGAVRGAPEWVLALQSAGVAMQHFRDRRQPDTGRVAEHLRGNRRLSHSPERADFGLPLTFRFIGPLRGQVEFNPSLQEPHTRRPAQRWPSPVRLKVIRAGGLHALVVRMDGDLPGSRGTEVRGQKLSLPPTNGALVDAFFEQAITGQPRWRRTDP